MKLLKFFIIAGFLFLVSVSLNAQKIKPDHKKGASFNFENYQFSTQGLYKEIDQSKIKSLKISFREIFDTVAVNNFLFNPVKREGNRISLAGLLFQAVKNRDINVYYPEYYYPEFFAGQISWEDIIKENIPRRIAGLEFNSLKDSTIIPEDIDTEEIKSYLLMEASIYGLNNKVLEVRPIGLCPIRTYSDEATGRIIRRQLFWIYFPDIMHLLSNYIPEPRIKGAKTTLDFFTKNRYRGDYFRFYHTNSPLLEGQIWGDTTSLVDGFDVKWIYDKIKQGIFINPTSKLFQGQGKKEMLQNSFIPEEPAINPDSAACAKYVYKTIDLRDIENYPLFFPESPYLTQKSLIDVICSGIEEGRYIVYQPEDSIPMTFGEVNRAMGEEYIAVSMQRLNGLYYDSLIMEQAIRSEVKKYIIKEAEFYDYKGTLINSRILGLIPVREWIDETTGRDHKRKLFFVPFNNPEFRKSLSQNDAYRFTSDDNFSFLSFFENRKFKAESSVIIPATVSNALKECGIQAAAASCEGSIATNLAIKPGEQPRIVFREVLNKDSVNYEWFPEEAINGRTENYQLFQPTEEMNGLTDFFDLIMSGIENRTINAYKYNPEGEFASELNLADVKRISRTSEDTSLVIDVESGKEYQVVSKPEKPKIRKYIIKEIQIGSAAQILGICPVLEYYEGNDFERKNPIMENAFWVPFTKSLRKELSTKEIIRVNCEAEKTFGEYFEKNRYRGKITEEKIISNSEAEQIISLMNR